MIQFVAIPLAFLIVFILGLAYYSSWGRKPGSNPIADAGVWGRAAAALAFIVVVVITAVAFIFNPVEKTQYHLDLWQYSDGSWYQQLGTEYKYFYNSVDGVVEGGVDEYYRDVQVIRTDSKAPRLEWDECANGWDALTIEDKNVCGSYRIFIPLTEPAK